MADFIEYTDEIFPNIKHYRGVCVEGKELYYLSESHALHEFVKNARKGYKVNFTSENMNMFIHKINYFLYPDKRSKSCGVDLKGKDISVKDFSFYCVNMFYKRFGIDFEFLRITPDKTDAAFVEKQKCCLMDLFYQCLYWLKIKKNIDECLWDKLLRMFYRDLRFRLSEIDNTYLNQTYDTFLKSELSEYAVCSSRAFHQLKNLYTHTNYEIGNDALVDEMYKAAKRQFKIAKETVRFISSLVLAKNKQDVKKVVEGLCSQNPPPIRLSSYESYVSKYKILEITSSCSSRSSARLLRFT